MSNQEPNYYVPAAPSKASRTITLKSSASNRGFLLNHTCHRWVGYESTLERDFLTVLLARSDVRSLREQPEPVSYVDADGQTRKHTCDALVQLDSGKKIACDVKANSRRESSGIDDVQRRVRDQNPGYADKFIVRTDREISHVQVRNAELIQRARTLWDEEAIEELRRHLASMHGFYPFASLVALLDDEAVGFNAVLNLIDAQELNPVTRSRRLEATELEICKAPNRKGI
jgi:hypothetical protein